METVYRPWSSWCGWAALVLVLLASPAEAEVRHVVLLQSFERGNLVLDRFTALLRLQVGEGWDEPVNFTEFVVNPAGFSDTPEEAIVEFLRSAFTGRPKPDLVITTGGPAAAFARKHRTQLFPDSPMLYAAVDQRFLKDGTFTDSETSVAVANDPAGNFVELLRVLPATETVFIVIGSGELGRFWRQEFERESSRFAPRVRFMWAEGLSYSEMLHRAATLPPRSVIYFSSFDVDGEGTTYPTERVLADLRARAAAPVFGAQSAEVGYGLLGGKMVSIDDLARTTADVALRILGGTSPGMLKTAIQQPGPLTFDWRELQRWGIREDRLPAGSVVLFREPSAWDRYKWIIIASASALLAQTALIGALLVQRARRRRAEQALQVHVADLGAARSSLSHLSGRLMEAQEQERARLARELHDDVGQKMSFLAMDVARLRESLTDDAAAAQVQADELQEDVIALGRDIQGISHRLHSSKIQLLGLRAAAESFCRELSSRHDLKVEFLHENVPSSLPDRIAIGMFRVLQEALANVVKHSGARKCRIVFRGTDNQLQLEVTDNGRGFDRGGTVAGHGLGLISMQERLNLLHGSVIINSTPGVGTTVRASVPLQSVAASHTDASSEDSPVASTTA
jgi:signal transduction histidine kinase